jgi:hypothetical protein
MAHFGIESKERVAVTGTPWLRLGSSIGKLVNQWSYRDDLVVFLGTKTTNNSPALFNTLNSEIEVDVVRAFGKFFDPEEITDFTQRRAQLEHPVASGAIFHEALHARFSRWSLADALAELKRRNREQDFQVLHFLEEGRIEAWGVRTRPENRVLLRASALEIVVSEISSTLEGLSNTKAIAGMCALTLARVDAGVLEDDEVESMRSLAEKGLTPEVLRRLQDVWVRFQAHDDHSNYLPLLDLAKEWNDIIEERQNETGEKNQQDGGNSQETQEILEKLTEILKDISETVQILNQDNLDDARQDEEWREEREKREAESKERGQNKKVAQQVFGRSSEQLEHPQATNSRLDHSRKPDPEERASAVRVARALEKAKYRERSETEINSVLPPGRLRTRAVVQGAALRARGVSQQTEVWRRTQRKHTDDPTLSVGVMVDISGSMRSAMEPMAVTAWVMSEAVRRVQGKCAMAYFGNDVFSTLRPGEHLSDVRVWTASDSEEKFEKGFRALDGALNLNHGDGARLLVIVSDGYYKGDEISATRRLLEEADRNGVAILWLDFDGGTHSARYLRGTSGKIVSLSLDMTSAEIASLIGKTATEVLERVGKKNA